MQLPRDFLKIKEMSRPFIDHCIKLWEWQVKNERQPCWSINGSVDAWKTASGLKNIQDGYLEVGFGLTFSTFFRAGTGFSTSFKSPQSGSSLSGPHLAYLRFLSMARKSMPLASADRHGTVEFVFTVASHSRKLPIRGRILPDT